MSLSFEKEVEEEEAEEEEEEEEAHSARGDTPAGFSLYFPSGRYQQQCPE